MLMWGEVTGVEEVISVLTLHSHSVVHQQESMMGQMGVGIGETGEKLECKIKRRKVGILELVDSVGLRERVNGQLLVVMGDIGKTWIVWTGVAKMKAVYTEVQILWIEVNQARALVLFVPQVLIGTNIEIVIVCGLRHQYQHQNLYLSRQYPRKSHHRHSGP